MSFEAKLKYSDSPFFQNISKLVIYQKNDVLKKAISYFLLKNYQEAQDYLLVTYPEYSLNEDSNALLLMGHIQLKLHQLDSAIEYFRQSLKMTEKDFFFINDSLGLIYFYKNDYDSAIKYIEEAWAFSENNYYYQFHLGLYHEALLNKKLKDNQDILNQKKPIHDNNVKMIKNEIEEIRKKIKDHYTFALKINPNSYNALLNIGSINASEGSSIAAENYYKKALELNEMIGKYT